MSKQRVSAKEAWAMLMEGHKRFLAGKPTPGLPDPARQAELLKGQHPFAVIVCCSDSRVCPEIIFNAGLGDLFVVRIAGNVVGGLELGSIQYAVEHLGVNLVVILGHVPCGAVAAAISENNEQSHELHSLIRKVKRNIRPLRRQARGQEEPPEFKEFVDANVTAVTEVISRAIAGSGAEVKKATYLMATGEVVE